MKLRILFLFLVVGSIAFTATFSSARAAVSGLVMDLDAPDQACVVEFDNFEVRVPPPPTANAQGKIIVTGFDASNAAQFPIGEYNDPPLSGKREIVNGKYRWEMLAPTKEIEQFATPKMEPVADFTASVSIKNVEGPERAWAGLAFRYTDADNYYKFDVTNYGSFGVSVMQNGEYDSLMYPTKSDAIKKGEPNRLKVVAKGSRFDLYINEQLVAQVNNSKLTKGNVGLVAMVYEPGTTGIYEFSEFEVRAP